MSLWYDIKNKIYSSGPMDNWYVNYLQNCCKNLTNAVTTMFSNHSSGLTGRHKAEHIDFKDGKSVRNVIDEEILNRQNADADILNLTEQNLNAEREARKDGLSLKVDKINGKQLSSNDYTDEEKLTLSKTAGKKVDGEVYSYVYRASNGDPYLVPSNELCEEGSEIFNDYAHNQAKAAYSHAEGLYTSACGFYSHTEGVYTKTKGMASHAEGENTIAAGTFQHVEGILNVEDTNNKYVHIVGNGYYEEGEDYTDTPVRSNAHTLDWKGNAWYAGDVVCGNAKAGLQAQITDLYNLRPTVLTEVSDELNLNIIYDLGLCDTLSLNVPDGQVGDWIKVDFISGETPTALSIITNNISDFNIVPEPNTAYSLIFDWGKITSDTYGWRFSYTEYTKVVS